MMLQAFIGPVVNLVSGHFQRKAQEKAAVHERKMEAIKQKVHVLMDFFAEVSDATSQLISTILGGMPGETLGGRAARSKHQVFWSAFCKCLNFVMSPRSRNHCERALDRDKERSKAILSVRRPYYRASRHG
jgi:hypothetical protein